MPSWFREVTPLPNESDPAALKAVPTERKHDENQFRRDDVLFKWWKAAASAVQRSSWRWQILHRRIVDNWRKVRCEPPPTAPRGNSVWRKKAQYFRRREESQKWQRRRPKCWRCTKYRKACCAWIPRCRWCCICARWQQNSTDAILSDFRSFLPGYINLIERKVDIALGPEGVDDSGPCTPSVWQPLRVIASPEYL